MADTRVPWTQEELESLLPKIAKSLDEIEAQQSERVKPLGPMTREQCEDYFGRLLDIAANRPLALSECFLHGQLLSCYRQAIQAEVLGKKGRYFVVSEDDLANFRDS